MIDLQLGQTVKYVNTNAEGTEIYGEGVIHSLFINSEGWIQVRVHDGELKFNLDLPAINPTEEGTREYFAYVAKIRAMADEINKEIKDMVDAGNAKIAKFNREYLGDPIVGGEKINTDDKE